MSIQISAAVVDSSALMCILNKEDAWSHFSQALLKVPSLFISAPTAAEVNLAAMATKGAEGLNAMTALIAALQIKVISFDEADLQDYKNAILLYHNKATPPGSLNMGDIFPFILAQKLNLPLFFQGLDFLQTPTKNAMGLLGYAMNAQNKGVPTPMIK